MLITRIRQGYFSLANKFVFYGKGNGVKVFIAISVAVFAFSALFLKVERCQKDSGGDYSHLWFVSGLVLNVDSSGDFTMSVESEDPYNDGSDRLTILVDSEHTRYVSDSPVSEMCIRDRRKDRYCWLCTLSCNGAMCIICEV